MASAEMNKEDIDDNTILSEDGSIQGKLHMEKILNIKINGKQFTGELKKSHSTAEIFNFEIMQNKVELQIKWNSRPPKLCIEDFSTIEVEAAKIWWENLPNLLKGNMQM